MSNNFPLNDIENNINDLISKIKFNPRTEITNTHRCTVDDHIKNLICYKIDKCSYYCAIFGYFITFGILFLFSYFYNNLFLQLYCNPCSPEESQYVQIVDFDDKKYICKVKKQNMEEINQLIKKNNQKENVFLKIDLNSKYLNKNLDEMNDNKISITFNFKNVKYFYNYRKSCFVPSFFSLSNYTNKEILDLFNKNITENKYQITFEEEEMEEVYTPNLSEYNYLLNKYGLNELLGESKSLISIILHHFFKFLNLYSLLCILIWIFTNYKQYAFLMIILQSIVFIFNVYTTYKMTRQIYNINKEEGEEFSFFNIKKKSIIKTTKNIKKERQHSYSLPSKNTYITTNNSNSSKKYTSYIRHLNEEVENNLLKSYDPITIVPGEIIKIRPNHRMFFDGLILNGFCTVDESELTGETNEVYKTQLPYSKDNFKYENKSHFLFQGTNIIQCANERNNDLITVLVLNTGMNTNRANLLLNLVFGKNGNYSFYKDIWIFGLIMFIFWLLTSIYIIYFKLSIHIFNLLTIILPPVLNITLTSSTNKYKNSLKSQNIQCINKDKITAAGKANIICLDKTGTLTENEFELYGYQFTMPNFDNEKKNNNNKKFEINLDDDDNEIILSKVEVSSKILNKIHQNFWKNYTLNMNEMYHEDPQYNIIFFTECLGCCHGIDKFEDKYLGDSIDKKMFCSIKWMIQNEEDIKTNVIKRYIMPSNLYKITEKSFFEELNENIKRKKEKNKNTLKYILNSESQYKILIEKMYNFNSESQSMAVITKNVLDKSRRIYIKGAPERILEKCSKKSKPKNINELIMNLTKKGLRVIACATRLLNEYEYIIKSNLNLKNDINPINIEKNMTFLGLVIFKNPLKKDTKQVIQKLSSSKFCLVMATGDNECTSYYVAQESKMIDNTINKRYIFDLEKSNQLYMEIQQVNEKKEQIEYGNLYSEDNFYNSSFNINYENDSNGLEIIKKIITKQKALVSISGSALNYIIKRLKEPNEKYIDKEKKCLKKDIEILIRKFGKIFYRMTPRNKAELIEFYKSDNKSIVIMCGDGSNDIPAILESDIGIALNQKSNMQILSHFYINNSSIQCVEIIVKTGRACFESNEMIFKSMILYGFIHTITLLCLENVKIPKLIPYQNLYSDIICVLIPIFFASQTSPNLNLAKEEIGTSLLNKKFIFSVLTQSFIQCTSLILFFYYLYYNVHYFKNRKDDEVKNENDNELTVFGSYLFLLSSFQYLLSIFVFNFYSVHRKHYTTNSLYNNVILFGMIITLFIVTINNFKNLSIFKEIIELESETLNFEFASEKNRFILIIFGTVNMILSLISEHFISKKIS